MATSAFHQNRQAQHQQDDDDEFEAMRRNLLDADEDDDDDARGGHRGGADNGDRGGRSLGRDDASVALAAAEARAAAEREARERAEQAARDAADRLAALQAQQQANDARLAALEQEREQAALEVTVEVEDWMIEQFGEDGARRYAERETRRARAEAQRNAALDRQLAQINATLEKSGLAKENGIDERIERRLQTMRQADWDTELHEKAPTFGVNVTRPEFKAWAQSTDDGPDSIWNNILTAIQRRSEKDLVYLVKVNDWWDEARGTPSVRETPGAHRRGTPGPRAGGRRRDESESDARERKAQARRRAAGWT